MQPKNLGWKFAFVALLLATCVYTIYFNELRQGIDLKGGHVLVFEVQSTGKEGPDLVQRVIQTLKQRIDPNNLYSLQWRPLGRNRFEVRMPIGTDKARRAKQAYLDALRVLEDGNLRRSQVRRVVSLSGQARAREIRRVSGGDRRREEGLWRVARAYDAEMAARRALEALKASGRASSEQIAQAQAKLDDARVAHDEAVAELMQVNVNLETLGQILELYITRREAKQIPLEEKKARQSAFCNQLEQLKKRHPARRDQIEAVVRAYKSWAEKRTGLDDPADLKRLVAKAGVLEFRIAPQLPLSGSTGGLRLSEVEYETYMNQLADEGPLPGRSRNDPYQWFPVRSGTEQFASDIVLGKYAGKRYILLCNQPDKVMLRDPTKPSWALKSAYRTSDELNRPAVGFDLDARGARKFGLLTGGNIGNLMAILLDDEVYSAPRIRSAIYERGTITGSFTVKEVAELVRILEAGSLQGRVNGNPVSERTIAPSIGEENRAAGFRAAIWGLIAVAGFMMIYYLVAGAIADAALLMNLVLILGAMSFIEAVFTLPGIAGVILTIGMAVDANVLIFERLREEQAKTQSMRMAFRNAYANAASAILDGNVTTLLTCVILGWVGTEEVRGFAITLGLGVVFSLFTALVVTRWIFQGLLELGLFKKRVRMLAFVGVPAVNWMAKRRIFWGLSGVLMVTGVAALIWQGEDILGIEFSSGTQAVFRFRPGALVPSADGRRVLPSRSEVERALKASAHNLAERRRSEAQRRSAGKMSAPLTPTRGSDPADEAGKLSRLAETLKVETLVARDKARDLMSAFDTNGDGRIDRKEWSAGKGSPGFFKAMDANGDRVLTRSELASRLPERSYQASTSVADVNLLAEVIKTAFTSALDIRTKVDYRLQRSGVVAGLDLVLKPADNGRTPLSVELVEKANPVVRPRLLDFVGGVMFVVTDVTPAQSEKDLYDKIETMRQQPDFRTYRHNRFDVIGLKADPEGRGFKSFAVVVHAAGMDRIGRPAEWEATAVAEEKLLDSALKREPSLVGVSEFSPAIAAERAQRAIIAFVLSWLAIVAYLWLRFGSARWGLAAVVCLVHDVVIAVGMVALSAVLADTFVGRALMISAFKIDMPMIAAFLTIIGYSVNDTIVVFDRIRENRGKLTTVDERTINRSINQTISRTLLTSTTTLLAVVVMYIWGGAGIHAFTYALLMGVIFGTYSSIAIASPLLLGFKHAVVGRIVRTPTPAAAK